MLYQYLNKRSLMTTLSSMVIGVCEITLHLPDSHSLKEKRQIIKSIIARVRNHFEIAIVEVDENDRWQIAILGVSCVSNSSQVASEVLERVRRFIEETRPDVLLSNMESEIIHW
jgi:uncharacterized protein